MKKLFILFALFFCISALIGCNKTSDEETCQHTWGEWQFNDEAHWRDYTCGHDSPEVAGEHTWDDGVEIEGGNGGYVMEYTCTVCGKKYQETITIIPPTQDTTICGVNHSYNDGVYVAPIEPTPGDVGDMLYICSVCGHEEIVSLPQVFSFTITFGFDGYYNSETSELRNGYNEELNVECKTILKLSDEELYKIYGIFYIGSIIDNTNDINASEDLIEPSYTIKISYSINYEERNFNIYGASYIDIEEWQEGYNIGYAYYKVLKDYILSSEEYKNLPPNTNLYE